MLNFYRAGKLNAAVWFDRRKAFDLADIAEALEAVRSRAMVKPLIKLQP